MATPQPAPLLSGIRRAVKRALFTSGYYGRHLSQLEFPGAAVLCYHSIRGDQEPPARRDRLVRSFQRDTIFLHVETVHDVR